MAPRIKYSNVMTTAQLTRANRIQGKTDGKRDLAAELKGMHRLMSERVRQGKAIKIGRSAWRAVY